MTPHDDPWSDPDPDACDIAWLVDATGPDHDLPAVPGDVLHGTGDLVAALLTLVGPERGGPPALWFLLLDEQDRLLPFVLPVADVPLRADAAVARQLVLALGAVLDTEAPGGSVVVGLVRASGGDRGTFESAWTPVLRASARDQGVRVRAVVAVGAGRARVLEW